MKTKHLIILGTSLFISSALIAQDKKDAKANPQAAAQQEKEMALWMDYMTPGEMHGMLAKCDGDWHEELVFWMEPGGEPTKAVSESTSSMVLGGRYQETIHKGDMMGMPFEGKGLTGYDNIKKVFQSTWVDNMGTGVMFLEGPYDKKTNSITLTGRMVDPMSGKTEKVRQIIKFVDDKTQKLEMYSTKGEKEFKSMEITMTKR